MINPADTYVAAAAVIDGATLYQTKSTTPVAPGATFDLVTTQSTNTIPVPGASASPGASNTAASGNPGASETPGASDANQATQADAHGGADRHAY